jgi:hypothetical protein
MNYYYLAASLPTPTLGEPPPMPSARFVALCAEHLSAADRAALERLMADAMGDESSAFGREWRDRERQLRNAVARVRAGRTKRDAAPYLRPTAGYDLGIEKAVADAFAKETPREREWALDEFRWRQLEELAGFDPFAGRAILAYGLKLKLVERWAAMAEPRGEETAARIVGRPAA